MWQAAAVDLRVYQQGEVPLIPGDEGDMRGLGCLAWYGGSRGLRVHVNALFTEINELGWGIHVLLRNARDG